MKPPDSAVGGLTPNSWTPTRAGSSARRGRLARCGRFKVRCRRGEPGRLLPCPSGKSPLLLAGLVAGTVPGLGDPRPPKPQTQKPRVARGNGSSRTKLWARPMPGWRWGCGSLRPPAWVGIVAQASRIPAKIIGIVSWLPQEYVPPSRPLPRTASVTERDRSEPRHITRTDGAEVVVLFRCGDRL